MKKSLQDWELEYDMYVAVLDRTDLSLQDRHRFIQGKMRTEQRIKAIHRDIAKLELIYG